MDKGKTLQGGDKVDYKEFEGLVDKSFSGVIYISDKNNEIYNKAYGYADKNNLIPNELTTRFPIASGSKIFTAISILQLIEKGLLSFDTSIGNILDFNLNKIDRNITIHQFLTHTSGIPDYFDEDIMKDYEELWIDYPMYKIRSSSDLLPLFIEKPMQYLKGSKFKYNNSGYVVLGLIIEKISGQNFYNYVSKNIFKPCNMLDTGYFELDRLPSRCANAYIYDEAINGFKTNIYSVDVKGTGAGGAFTTATDMAAFWNCFLEYKLISMEMTQYMLSPQAKDDNSIYGYGIWLREKENGSYIYYLMGSDPGISFNSFVDIDNNLKVVIMSNVNDNVWKYSKYILEMFV